MVDSVKIADQFYYTYLLDLGNGKYYAGHTSNLKNRLKEHIQGKVLATNRAGFRLVWYSAFRSELLAIRFEKYLKSSSGFVFRNKRLV